MDQAKEITKTIEGYFRAFDALDAEAVLDLFAEGATVEDPVGTPIKTDRAQLLAFFKVGMEMKAKLKRAGDIRIAGNEAAFPFTVSIKSNEGEMNIDVIDVMTFDKEAKITSMRAFFGPTNITNV